MVRAKKQFDDSFVRISRIDHIYINLIHVMALPVGEVEDLLRSEIVYAVSALDRLIHDLVKIGMIEIFLSARPVTIAYNNFQLTLSQHADINTASTTPPPEAIFQAIIESKHGYLTFQDSDKIKDALNLIWNETYKWQQIAARMGITETVIRQTLNNIVIRRNQIVHEMDLDLATGTIQPIAYADATSIVTFIRNVGNNIYDLVT